MKAGRNHSGLPALLSPVFTVSFPKGIKYIMEGLMKMDDKASGHMSLEDAYDLIMHRSGTAGCIPAANDVRNPDGSFKKFSLYDYSIYITETKANI